MGPLAYPVHLACAHVLAHKIDQGGAERKARLCRHTFNFGTRRISSHHIGAEPVHCPLDRHAADGTDAIGQGRRHTQPDQGPGQRRGKVPIAAMGNQEFVASAHIKQTADTRKRLADNGCQSRAGRSHGDNHHQQQVQNNIAHRRNDQKYQRRPAVAHRPENARKQVIVHHAGNAPKDDDDIEVGVVENILRRLHNLQNGRGKYHADGGNRQGKQCGKLNTHRHRVAQFPLLFAAVQLGDDDGEARRQTKGRAQDKKADGAGTAHGRHGLLPHEAAHNDGIHHAVELLKQIADENGHAQGKQQPDGSALCQILCHMVLLYASLLLRTAFVQPTLPPCSRSRFRLRRSVVSSGSWAGSVPQPRNTQSITAGLFLSSSRTVKRD